VRWDRLAESRLTRPALARQGSYGGTTGGQCGLVGDEYGDAVAVREARAASVADELIALAPKGRFAFRIDGAAECVE
jgi:hypothetical protein